MMDASTEDIEYRKSGARRFSFSAGGVLSYYLACDLDEGILRFWPEDGSDRYWKLLLSPSRDERDAYRTHDRLCSESGKCIGVELTDEQIQHIEELLTEDSIKSMRGIDDAAMRERGGGLCYRDGWGLGFYAEGDADWPPLRLDHIVYTSFIGDELPFEKLEHYVTYEVLGRRCEAFFFDVSHKANPEKTEEIVERAIHIGLSAIEEILWYGHGRLLRKLDETDLPHELSYSLSDDSFTVRYGNRTSRFCKLGEPPACERVFGREHVFGCRA